MSKELILVIDDETHILELIRYNLEKEGYGVTVSENGEAGLRALQEEQPDLVVLDLMLPGIDGIEVCKRIRNGSLTAALPVLMLTARGEETDKVLGLETGADDYLTKPFGVRELTARIRALLRRSSRVPEEPDIINIGNIVINAGAFRVYKNKQEVTLTNKEYELFKILALNRGNVLTRDYLLNEVWGYEYLGDTRTVDVHIRRLRKKIEDNDKDPKYIQTVRGTGYSINYEGD